MYKTLAKNILSLVILFSVHAAFAATNDSSLREVRVRPTMRIAVSQCETARQKDSNASHLACPKLVKYAVVGDIDSAMRTLGSIRLSEPRAANEVQSDFLVTWNRIIERAAGYKFARSNRGLMRLLDQEARDPDVVARIGTSPNRRNTLFATFFVPGSNTLYYWEITERK